MVLVFVDLAVDVLDLGVKCLDFALHVLSSRSGLVSCVASVLGCLVIVFDEFDELGIVFLKGCVRLLQGVSLTVGFDLELSDLFFDCVISHFNKEHLLLLINKLVDILRP